MFWPGCKENEIVRCCIFNLIHWVSTLLTYDALELSLKVASIPTVEQYKILLIKNIKHLEGCFDL